MNAKPSELQTLGGRIFFWIGLIILPLFWVWWMRHAYFNRTQRIVGWVWTACYVAALLVFRQYVGERLQVLSFAHPVVAHQLGLALWLWWLFRVFSVTQLVVFFLVSVDVIATVASVLVPAWRMSGAPPAAIWLFALVPAVLHLLVEPVRKWRKRSSPDAIG